MIRNIMDKVSDCISKMCDARRDEEVVDIVEKTLGKGGKVSQCNAKQYEAVEVILNDLMDALA